MTQQYDPHLTQRTPASPAPIRHMDPNAMYAPPPPINNHVISHVWPGFGAWFKAGLAAGLGLIVAGLIPLAVIVALTLSAAHSADSNSTSTTSCIFPENGC